MKPLLTITALFEGATGVALLAAPSLVARLLLNAPVDSPAGLAIARILAAGLISLAIASWLARRDAPNRTAQGLVAALLTYNFATAGLLSYAGIALRLVGIALVPGILFHAALLAWCAWILRGVRQNAHNGG